MAQSTSAVQAISARSKPLAGTPSGQGERGPGVRMRRMSAKSACYV